MTTSTYPRNHNTSMANGHWSIFVSSNVLWFSAQHFTALVLSFLCLDGYNLVSKCIFCNLATMFPTLTPYLCPKWTAVVKTVSLMVKKESKSEDHVNFKEKCSIWKTICDFYMEFHLIGSIIWRPVMCIHIMQISIRFCTHSLALICCKVDFYMKSGCVVAPLHKSLQ